MTSDCKPRSLTRDLLNLLWRQPLWAIPFGLFFGTVFGSALFDYWRAYQMSLVFGFSIGTAIVLTRHFVQPRMERQGNDDAGEGLRIGIAYTVACVFASYVAAFIIHFTLLPGFMGSWRSIAIATMFTLLFSALFMGINYAIEFYRKAVERGRAVETMRAELAVAELRALRAQLHPHFLFNTLNSIAALIRIDPEAAEETTTRLADVFRYVLRASDTEHARLGDELAFVLAYLDIERTRFGDRVRVKQEIQGGLESVSVPSLLLQPLVENAIRHGLASQPEGGTLTLRAHRDGDLLTLEVADDGAGMNGDAAASSDGFGLRSVRERLEAAGPPHRLDIESAPGKGTHVRVTLPCAPLTPTSPSLTKGASS